MTYTFRPGTPGDALACARVHRKAASIAYRPFWPEGSEPPPVEDIAPGWRGIAAVAEAGEEIVAGVAVHPDDRVPTGWVLARLYVHPDHQGAGLGRELVDRAVASAAADGATAINLWVLETNELARRFYERLGWRLVPGPTVENEGTHHIDVLYQLDDLG